MNLSSLYTIMHLHALAFSLSISFIVLGSIARRLVEIKILARRGIMTATPSQTGEHPFYSKLAMVPFKIAGYSLCVLAIACGYGMRATSLTLLYTLFLIILPLTPWDTKPKPRYSESSKLQAPTDRLHLLRATAVMAMLLLYAISFLSDQDVKLMSYGALLLTIVIEYCFYRLIEIPFWASRNHDLVKGAPVTQRPTACA